MSLCLAAAGITVQIAASSFTLAWTHTVERTAWEEDWRIAGGDLVLAEARVRGSGAGMEPPPQARLENGFYAWMPSAAPLEELVLRRAPQAGDWRLCAAGQCATIREWLGGEADPVRLFAAAGEGGCVSDPAL
jgi:hypothetical protein